jgi:3-hydroxyacyl-CoA dehydrogenase
VPDPLVARLAREASAARGIVRRAVPPAEIQARARAAMVNEAARILEEGIAARPADIDLILVHGYGYPAWRGGPMFDADRTGLALILADVERLYAASGIGFEPAPLLVRLAAEGRGFSDWAKETGRD